MDAAWRLRRLSRMGPQEVAGRAVTAAKIRRWRGEVDNLPEPRLSTPRRFTATLPPRAYAGVETVACRSLLDTADRLMAGSADYFGLIRHDMVNPDWSLDPRTRRRAPEDVYAFDIPYRDERAVGDIKQLWEPSRHQHLTVLAAAYALTGDERYAARVADHLKSWWAANPPLRGVHWVSGIELGIRVLSWVWVRRLLDGWTGAPGLFEDNDEALHQIWHHQRWLATFASHGSSANNHAIAEAAGQLAASCAFPWFEPSPLWRDEAMRLLDRHLTRNTFDSGINRELATEYHGLVLELGLAAAIEADVAGVAVPASTWRVLIRMTDALAAMVDTTLVPPRQGDGDDGHGLIVDGGGTNRWASLLATGAAIFGDRTLPSLDVRTALLAGLAQPSLPPQTRPYRRPAHFPDAGLTILRAKAEKSQPEIWCRCDAGPHGFLSIAAHAHADALSIELRHGGVDILADPGTYCYHSQPEWRSYFRSTLGHNTLELDGKDQSRSGGPFLWTRHARSRVLVAHAETSGVSRWRGEHGGYGRRRTQVVHRRSVELDGIARAFTVTDEVISARRHDARLAFHLGPLVHAELIGDTAHLSWSTTDRHQHRAVMRLPGPLSWSAHRGETNPPLGWYSPGFGRKLPSTVVLGTGNTGGDTGTLTTVLEFGGRA